MAFNDDKAAAIQKLYDKLLSDLAVIMDKPCDVTMLVHPQHEEGKCEGMALHSNADPIQAHKLAFNHIMWAERQLDNYQAMMSPAPQGAKLN